jgi:zinc D-Ala-D-Ala carboxypeptidase
VAPKLSRAMKGWLVGLALMVVLGASVIGLWITWDSTQASPDPVAVNTSGLAAGPTTASTTTTTTIPPLPDCQPGDDGPEVIDLDPDDDWATAIIDPGRRLPEDYTPDDLVDATEAGFASTDQVRAIVIDDLAALRAAAEANGSPIVMISGYRSFSYQQVLFIRQVAQVGEEEAALRTARPGHSEHQLGTAIDVLDPEVGDLTPAFAERPAGQWLAENAHEYGFVISYPEGARETSCYEFEPWHLRYVGREAAAEIHESGVAPREWMWAARATADD